MSYHERRALLSIISTIGITALYVAFMLPRYPVEVDAYAPEVFRYWGNFFLLLIPVTIAARIVLEILFVIVNTIFTREAISDRTDERDKLIELKSTRNALWTFMLGFVLAIGSLSFDVQPSAVFALLIAAGLLSSLVSDVSDFFFYRRGY
jgi:hypothetical protein